MEFDLGRDGGDSLSTLDYILRPTLTKRYLSGRWFVWNDDADAIHIAQECFMFWGEQEITPHHQQRIILDSHHRAPVILFITTKTS